MSLQLKTERETFIENNIGLVHSCAKRFKGKGIEYEEMFAAGCVGLIKAYDAFDHSRGVQFSTYAVPVILGEIKKLFRDGGMLKVTRSVKEMSLKVSYTREHLQKQTGQEPSVKEIADFLAVSVEDVAQAISASTPPMSLTAIFEEEDGQCEFDIPVESSEESLANIMGLKYAISELEAEEKQIIYMRFFSEQNSSCNSTSAWQNSGADITPGTKDNTKDAQKIYGIKIKLHKIYLDIVKENRLWYNVLKKIM